ncbi:ROK family [Phytophthora cactorum]|nr:ROK family [Phytophthora cactorum]
MTAAVMFAGVDIGATGVKVGVVTSEGAVVAREQENYHPEKHEPQDVVDLAISVLHKVLETVLRCDFAVRVIHQRFSHSYVMLTDPVGIGDLEAVGVGCPGVLEAGGVTVCNDADAAILAEQWVGTAKGGIKDFIMLTLGTGVGFGVVANGELVRGGSNAIEGIVERNGRPCGCSQRGCLEAYSSAGALMSQVQEHLRAGSLLSNIFGSWTVGILRIFVTLLHEYVGRDSSLSKYSEADINAEFVFKHAAQGDELCKHLIEEVRGMLILVVSLIWLIISRCSIEQAADYLGFACVTFCRMLDPEIIVLSGGIAEAGETYIEKIRRAYAKHTWIKFPNPVRIEKASAGYDSGIIGAVAVCKNQRKGQ